MKNKSVAMFTDRLAEKKDSQISIWDKYYQIVTKPE